MIIKKFKKSIKYIIIPALTFNTFSGLPNFSAVNEDVQESLKIKLIKNNLDTNYFKKIPLNDYIIGPGDVLSIKISRDYPELSSIATVDGEGTIYLSRLKRIYVQGLSIKELNLLLNEAFKPFIKFPAAEVEVSQYRPVKVLVDGEVSNPGIKKFRGALSLSFPSNDTIEFPKKEENLKAKKEDNESIKKPNFESQPKINKFPIFPTVIDAIIKSGGITEYSDLTSIEIIRKNNLSEGGGKIKTEINLEGFLNKIYNDQNIRIYDGDIIYLKRSKKSNPQLLRQAMRQNISPRKIDVMVIGRVKNGTINVFRDATLNDAISLAGGTKILKGPVRFLSYKSNGTIDKRVFRYSPKQKRGSYKNPYLNDGDFIVVGDSLASNATKIITELTAPFQGLYFTYALIEAAFD